MIEDVLGEGPVSASRFSQWFSSTVSPSGSRSSSLRSTPHEELEKLAGKLFKHHLSYFPDSIIHFCCSCAVIGEQTTADDKDLSVFLCSNDTPTLLKLACLRDFNVIGSCDFPRLFHPLCHNCSIHSFRTAMTN